MVRDLVKLVEYVVSGRVDRVLWRVHLMVSAICHLCDCLEVAISVYHSISSDSFLNLLQTLD